MKKITIFICLAVFSLFNGHGFSFPITQGQPVPNSNGASNLRDSETSTMAIHLPARVSETSSAQCYSTNAAFFNTRQGIFGSSGGIHDLKTNKAGYTVALLVWLLILLYVLGTTASDYFSCTLEKLSKVLRLPPAVAGATLLAIGNGAPDIFASIMSFVSSDESESIGFSSVLGGALFVTTVVSGSVSIVTWRSVQKIARDVDNGRAVVSLKYGLVKEDGEEHNFVRIEGFCFVRDSVFLLASIGILAGILLDGEVYLWESILLLFVYPLYTVSVWMTESLEACHRRRPSLLEPFLIKAKLENSLPCWTDVYEAPQPMLFHVHSELIDAEQEYYGENQSDGSVGKRLKYCLHLLYKYCIQWPFALPRQLTIPVIEEERWSRPFAVASCSLAPVFVAGVWILEYSTTAFSVILGVSGAVGFLLGVVAFLSTENERPPQRFLWLWLAGGFLMSIIWFYLVADELVATLERLGILFGIDPSVLGLTILAWGNSIGDLMADLSLAQTGKEGVQIAISGCYAGPLFNTTVGLGLCLLVSCLKSRPEPLCVTDEDGDLFYMIGFLGAGLIWGLFIMSIKGMRLTRKFGVGLMFIYGSFLVVGLCYVTGWIS